jgi:hypothetical protein
MTGWERLGIGGLSRGYLSGHLSPSGVLDSVLARIAAPRPPEPFPPGPPTDPSADFSLLAHGLARGLSGSHVHKP